MTRQPMRVSAPMAVPIDTASHAGVPRTGGWEAVRIAADDGLFRSLRRALFGDVRWRSSAVPPRSIRRREIVASAVLTVATFNRVSSPHRSGCERLLAARLVE